MVFEMIVELEDARYKLVGMRADVKELGNAISIDELRKLAEDAGAFVHSKIARVYTYPTDSFLGVYNATEADATVYLPEDGVYRDLIENGVYECRNGKLCLPRKPIRAYLLVKE